PQAAPWIATVLANRMGGILVAGKIDLAKLQESVEGVLTKIDYSTGEFWINGEAAITTGTRCRLNDPSGAYSTQPSSVQTGPGLNGSADERCQTDPQNPIVTAFTGYPMRIPSVDPASADDAQAPQANRNQSVDSAVGGLVQFFAPKPSLQAPVLVGDR